jgi:predicted nucleic acid-binding protein
LIAYLKGREPGAGALAKAIQVYECCISTITAYEILYGVARAQKEIGETDLLSRFSVLPFDLNAAKRAATLHDQLIRRNQDIGIKDVFIAAICLENDLALLTFNVNHFSRVADLRVLTPEDFMRAT